MCGAMGGVSVTAAEEVSSCAAGAVCASCRDTTKAGDDEVASNLMGLVQTRPDIFGEPAPLGKEKPCNINSRHRLVKAA